jgi:hypothetical protein
MHWAIRLHDDFGREFDELPPQVCDEVRAIMLLLREYGPRLRRPHADTLKGSRHANMKELRFQAADGVWRVTYAFDPNREAILLAAGDKSGCSEQNFYRKLIAKSDVRYDAHLRTLKQM